jgi:ubiquitin-conjugating enzyme E2 H
MYFFVLEYVSRFATKEAADAANESSSEDEVSSVDSYSDEEEVPEMEL